MSARRISCEAALGLQPGARYLCVFRRTSGITIGESHYDYSKDDTVEQGTWIMAGQARLGVPQCVATAFRNRSTVICFAHHEGEGWVPVGCGLVAQIDRNRNCVAVDIRRRFQPAEIATVKEESERRISEYKAAVPPAKRVRAYAKLGMLRTCGLSHLTANLSTCFVDSRCKAT